LRAGAAAATFITMCILFVPKFWDIYVTKDWCDGSPLLSFLPLSFFSLSCPDLFYVLFFICVLLLIAGWTITAIHHM
jgi:hypothetical protein